MRKATGKIQKMPLKSGDAYYLKVVHNLRINQVPTNQLIKTLLYIPAKQNLNDRLYQIYAWEKINRELQNLYLQKKISLADVKSVKKRFERFLPRPQSAQPIELKTVNLSKYADFI